MIWWGSCVFCVVTQYVRFHVNERIPLDKCHIPFYMSIYVRQATKHTIKFLKMNVKIKKKTDSRITSIIFIYTMRNKRTTKYNGTIKTFMKLNHGSLCKSTNLFDFFRQAFLLQWICKHLMYMKDLRRQYPTQKK